MSKRLFAAVVCVVALSIVVSVVPGAEPHAAKKKEFIQHVVREIHGWQVHVDPQLIEAGTAAGCTQWQLLTKIKAEQPADIQERVKCVLPRLPHF